MKKKIKLFLSSVVFICGIFTSCENLLSVKEEKQTEQSYIRISTNLSSVDRSVLPSDSFKENTTGLTWTLSGSRNGTAEITIKVWNDEGDTAAITQTAYQKMISDSFIPVDEGTWIFTLTAKNNSGKVLEATREQKINGGENTLSFVMAEATGIGAASGQIEFTLKWKEVNVVGNVAITLSKRNDSSFKDIEVNYEKSTSQDYEYVNFSAGTDDSPLEAGSYMLKMELRQQTGFSDSTEATYGAPIYKTINTYTCLIHVAPGLCSKGEAELETLAPLYAVTFEDGIEFKESIVSLSYNAYTTFALPRIKEEDGYEYQWYKNGFDFYANSYYQESIDDPLNVSITEDTTFGVKCYKIVDEKDIVRTAKGDSTTGESFSIGTAEGLGIFRDLVNGCNENLKMVDNSGESEEVFVYYETGSSKSQLNATLTSDIDLTQLKDADGNKLSWVPINGYSGTFDGGDHTITVNNTYQVNGNLYYQGFFDTLDGATIKNLVVAGEETISELKLDYCGGIASQIKNQRGVNTTFENCVNKRNITVTTGVEGIGGFAGDTSSSDVETNFVNCINLGTIENNYNASDYYAPYVAGFTKGATSYRNCINAGNVTGATFAFDETTIFGTVAGFDASGSASFTNCINLGDISANSYTADDGVTYSTEKVYGFSSIDQYNYPTFTNCIDAGSAKQPFTDFDVNITVTYNTCYYNSDSYGSNYNTDVLSCMSSNDLCKQEKTKFSNWSYDSSNSRYPLPKIEENFSEKIWQEVVAKAIPKVSNFEMLKNRITSANGTAENLIVLNGNIDIAETLEITTPIKIIASTSAGVTITRGLDGSGSASAFTGAFFDNQSTLTLEGITLDGAKNSSIEATAPLITSSGNLTLNNCTLQNNTNNTGNGGGVYVANKAIFTMGNGATISNCTGYNGGGVYVSGGTFTMNGGAISGCTAEQGGGVYVLGGTFTMENNSLISKNTSGGNGGGIFAEGGNITINGGSISENIFENEYSGGGIYLTNSATLEMSDGKISGNCPQNTDPSNGTNGGGVMVSEATFTMTGGEILGNLAYSGGGVFVSGGKFSMSGGKISSNICTYNGKGVSVYNLKIEETVKNAIFEMSGGAYVNSINDVYLANGTTITVTGNLTSTDTVATITPDEYSATRQVLVAGSGVALSSSLVKQFNVTPDNNGNEWFIDSAGYLVGGSVIAPEISENGEFEVSSFENLLWIALELKRGSFKSFKMKLTDDIEIQRGKWQFYQLNVTEESLIDGQGHSITIDEDVSKFGNDAGGLFYKFNNSTVKNLVLNGSITANTSAGGYIGALCRSAYRTTIQNVMSTVEINDEGSGNAGGLVGYFGGNNGVEDNKYTPDAFIKNCAVYADISSENGTAGGLVGESWANTQTWKIENCIYKGTVSSKNGVAGALIGNENTGKTSYLTDIWYYESNGCAIFGKEGNAGNITESGVVKLETDSEIASEAAANLLNTTSDGTSNDAWEYVSGDYPTLKSVN